MARPFIFGNDYGSIEAQQGVLDNATTNRALASQQMLREVQRAAVAQRQQEIATQLAAQQQADYAAQREQENQFRLAQWMASLQDRNQGNARYREETTYGRGQDQLGNMIRMLQLQENSARNRSADQLAREEFDFRKSQPSPQAIRQAEIDRQVAEEDANKMRIAKNMADLKNRLSSYTATEAALPGIKSEFDEANSWWRRTPNDAFKEQLRALPITLNENINPYLSGDSKFLDAYARIDALNKARLAEASAAETDLARSGGDLVRQQGNRWVPSYIPRSAMPSATPQLPNPVATPPMRSSALDPGVQEVLRLQASGMSRSDAIKTVKQVMQLSVGGSSGRMTRTY